MRTRTSAHLPEVGGGAVRGPPGPHWALCQRRDADEDVRAPPKGRRRRGARTSRSALGLVPTPGCGRGRPRTSQGSAAARCADLPVRIGPRANAGLRTRTSAHLPRVGGGAVRGPPGPHWASCQRRDADGDVRAPPTGRRRRGARASSVRIGSWRPGRNADEDVRAPPTGRRRRGARTSRSALGLVPTPGCGRGRPRTSHGSAAARCADLPVRIESCATRRDADEDVRAPPKGRRRRGARTSRSALGLVHNARMRTEDVRAPRQGSAAWRGARTSRSALGLVPTPGCGRGRPRTSQGSAAARCADLPVRIGPRAQRRNADRGRPRTSPGVEPRRGARTSRSALGLVPTPGCGRGRPRTSQGSAAARCADLPVRIGPRANARMRTEDVRAPPTPSALGAVRGPPGPHWASCQRRVADEDVRAPPTGRRRRGARTSRSALGLVPTPGCGRGRPRTSHGSAAARCADLPVRIGSRANAGMRTGTFAHLPEVRGRPRPHPGVGTRSNADREVRAPRRCRTLGGARTSSSASRRWHKTQCGPGGPRTAPPPTLGRCADVLVRIPAVAQDSMRTGRSAHRAAAEPWEVRGRPRPQPGVGTRLNADREVRAPRRRRTLGGARTSSSASRRVAQDSMRTGGPRTAPPPNRGRCADVLVRIPALAQDSMQAGMPAVPARVPAYSACFGSSSNISRFPAFKLILSSIVNHFATSARSSPACSPRSPRACSRRA